MEYNKWKRWSIKCGFTYKDRKEAQQRAPESKSKSPYTYIGFVEMNPDAKSPYRNYFAKRFQDFPENVNFDRLCQVLIRAIARLNRDAAKIESSNEQRIFVNNNIDKVVRITLRMYGVDPKIMNHVSLVCKAGKFKPMIEVGSQLSTDYDLGPAFNF